MVRPAPTTGCGIRCSSSRVVPVQLEVRSRIVLDARQQGTHQGTRFRLTEAGLLQCLSHHCWRIRQRRRRSWAGVVAAPRSLLAGYELGLLPPGRLLGRFADHQDSLATDNSVIPAPVVDHLRGPPDRLSPSAARWPTLLINVGRCCGGCAIRPPW